MTGAAELWNLDHLCHFKDLLEDVAAMLRL